MSRETRVDVFLSYSHHDKWWKDLLFKEASTRTGCFALPSTLGPVTVWADDDIRAGDEWDEKITQALNQARIAVLLVTNRFLESAYIAEKELPTILARSKKSQLQILWVPIEKLKLKAKKNDKKKKPKHPFSKFQAACNTKPTLQHLRDNNLDGELEKTLGEIRSEILRTVDPLGQKLKQVVAAKYDIVRRIGEGHIASVYEASDARLARSVAIKTLKDEKDESKFETSIKNATRVDDQDAIITVFGAWMGKHPYHCVMRHIDGQSLRHLLKESRAPLELDYVRDFLIRIGSALAYAHEKQFFHLNIKPSNIMIDNHNRAFISAFSRANDFSGQRLIEERGKGMDEEELAYLLPEHFARSRRISEEDLAKADQYLLGLVAYEMITGKLPNIVAGYDEIIAEKYGAFSQLKPLDEVSRVCPAELAKTIMQMTRLDPDDRFDRLSDAVNRIGTIRDVNLSCAKDSYRRCIENEAKESSFFTAFYEAFKDKSELAKERFASTDMERQHELLKEALLLLFVYREEDKREPTVLTRVARRHDKGHLDISPEHYETFEEALLGTVATFDPNCTHEDEKRDILKAWRVSLKDGIDYMKSRYDRI